jgi:hypothetical protein
LCPLLTARQPMRNLDVTLRVSHSVCILSGGDRVIVGEGRVQVQFHLNNQLYWWMRLQPRCRQQRKSMYLLHVLPQRFEHIVLLDNEVEFKATYTILV